ncbi:serine/threonine-protein kinase ULK1a isoform X3 [Clupea harengus]|uniref:non-specific serine/threonine protein kinase n=1 Tax=Clupea harengus TaxID=7950 RepID=A0A6P8FRW5_CLUHA|nr:serine/threonine-protein kinase ULK1a isoform X3 [Clupea harengus]
METVGKFEFNRKDLIGHGAFAVVFKGRYKKRHDLEVAVKCINKKNLAKSQSLLGKEIKILKELKHENIVGLLDFQEISGCVYLVMEYCNGGDLAEYLQSKGSLREDTIRIFLQQIAGAMSVLRSKGIIHRDLKPQNILLAYNTSRRASPSNICIKIADFGFARYLQGDTMAATLCGSPMYMAPEVIMSQNYDAKADLWSVGTIVYQCLTGKAPFQASSPQELRLFYERNRNLTPSVPRETSGPLRQLLLGLLQRNHKDRMDFDQFFHHPFLQASSSSKKSSPVPVPVPSYPSTGSGSSCSSSSTHLTPTQSDAEAQSPLQRPATPFSPDSLLKDSSSSEPEDFIMVPAQFTSEIVCDAAGGQPTDSLMQSGFLLAAGASAGRTPLPSPSLRTCPSPVRPAELCGSNYSQSVPIPVPTQTHNYQRMEQNLQSPSRTTLPMQHCCGKAGSFSPVPSEAAAVTTHRGLSGGGCRPYQPSPLVGTIPERPNQVSPRGTRTGMQRADLSPKYKIQTHVSPQHHTDLGTDAPQSHRKRTHRQSPDPTVPKGDLSRRPSSQNLGSAFLFPRTRTVPNLKELEGGQGTVPTLTRHTVERRGESVKRSMSTGRLSDMLLKAVFGAQLDRGSTDNLNMERPMDTTVGVMGSPSRVVFTVGSPSSGPSPPLTSRPRLLTVGSSSPVSPGWTFGGRQAKAGAGAQGEGCDCSPDPNTSPLSRGIAFEPPELPEDTLMEQEHTDAVGQLRFILAFSHCIMEIAAAKDSGIETCGAPDASFLEQSMVADQISLLSREWSYAELLVLYMKSAELLSSALHTAMEDIKQGKIYASCTVKQVVRKMNELYKSSVSSSRSLSARLQLFFTTKQRLMDRINSITAEKLIYAHAVSMVQSTALDEMFHQGEASVERYHKALLLMEGLTFIITEPADIHNIDKCKQCIERRLSALQPGTYV